MDISEFSRLNDQSNYQRHPWETSRKKVLFRFLKDSGIKFPVDRIVDIGSGDAYVIHSLAEKNFSKNYFAIDIAYTSEIIEQLKANHVDGKVNYMQNLENYFQDFPSNKNTLFLCMDVLEHLENEKIILDHLTGSGNNFYFFAVPAFQSVFSSHDDLLGHFRRYSLPELKNLLQKNSFEIRQEGYYFTSLLLFRKLDKLLKRDKKASIDNWNGGKIKTNAINKMLAIDFRFGLLLKKFGVQIPGLSCYCLCKK